MSEASKTPVSDRKNLGLFALALLLFALVLFRVVLPPDSVLMTTDDGYGALAYSKAQLPYSLQARWIDQTLAGFPSHMVLRWTSLLLWLLPLNFFVNWIHAIDLGLASIFLALFLRLKGRSWTACGLAALTAFWLGSNFTLTYAGHMGKFACLLFGAMSLWGVEKAVQTRQWAWSLFAGGAVGAMFLEQQDVALFMGLFIGAYALFASLRVEGKRVAALATRLLPMGLMALLVGGVAVFKVYEVNVDDVVAVDNQDPQRQWEFCTQWSWPPEESIDFIAPGFTGWRSNEPTGPYTGRMGRSPGWETSKQGFRNFKLENHYLGVIPVFLALWALAVAFRFKDERVRRADILFWGGVALLSLFLAFGKYFFLYRLFYALPGISSIRNPNKFFHIFQVAVGIMAAYGLDLTCRATVLREAGPGPRRYLRNILIALAVVGGLMGLLAVGWMMSEATLVQRFVGQGWGEAAPVIVQNRIHALAHGAVLALGVVTVIAITVMIRRKDAKSFGANMAMLLVAVTAVDAAMLASHYIQPLSKKVVARTDLVKFLETHLGAERLALFSQANFYNHWLTYLLPYYEFPTLNVSQMPRMPKDYQALLSKAPGRPFRLWNLSSCAYLMGPSGFWGQIQNDPALKERCELVYAFNVGLADGVPVAVPGTAEQPGQHCVLAFDAIPRFAVYSAWRESDDEAALTTLFDEAFDPQVTLLVPTGDADGLPASAEALPEWDVALKKYRAGYAELQVSSDRSAILRFGERYDPNWTATVDGRPVPIHRVDYLFQAIPIPAGLHTVVFRFAPSRNSLWMQLAGLGVWLAVIGLLVVKARKPADPHP